MPAPTKNGGPMVITPDQFLQISKAKTVNVINGKSYVENGVTNDQLPQAGLGAILRLTVQGTITVAGTVTGGTFKNPPYPAPWSLIRNFRITSNNALNIRDMSGWGLYKWVRYRYGVDPAATTTTVGFSASTIAALGQSGTRVTPGGSVSATTFNINFSLPIDLAYNRAGRTGLLVLQFPSTYYNVQITWGSVTTGMGATGGSNDIFNAVTGSGQSYTASITYNLGLEYFDMPDRRALDYSQQVAFFMNVTEQVQTPLNQGENIFRLPPGDLYTMILAEAINNSAPLTPAQIQLPKFQHSGSVWLYNEDFYSRMNKDYYEHRLPGIDGVLAFDLGLRKGWIGQRDPMDAFNNMNVTDAQIRFTIPSTVTITGTNQLAVTMESLRAVNQ